MPFNIHDIRFGASAAGGSLTLAAGTLAGNNTGSSGPALSLTPPQAKTLLALAVADVTGAQSTLVSGTNIKTVNGISLLGSGDIPIAGAGGDVTGPASAVSGNVATFSGTTGKVIADSGVALSSKQATLVAGTNIKNVNGVSMLGSGNVILTAPALYDGFNGFNNVANTAYVDQMLGNVRDHQSLTIGITLTMATHAGKTMVLVGSSPFTVTLPGTPASSGGMRIGFVNLSTATWTIARQGTDNIVVGTNSSLTSITLAPGGALVIEGDTHSGNWYVVSGNQLGLGTPTGSGSSTGTNTGDQTITLTGDVTGSGTGSFAATIGAGKVTLAQQANMATASVVYRKTAGSGAPEVQPLATLKTDLGLTGTNSGDQTITLTGDVTGSGTGSFAATIGAGTVTLAKQANLAANSFQGNNTASPATPLALTVAQAKTLLAMTAADVGAPAGSGNSTGTNTGDQTITLTGDVTGSGTGSFAATIGAGKVTLAQQANMATASVVYRKTAGSGAPEVQTLATLKTDLGLTGTNSGDQTITLTGDVTGSGTGSFAGTLATVNANVGSFTNASITVDGKGRITAASTGSGGGGTTTNAVTFNNGGAGAASGTTFNGSAAQTISYNTVGAQATLVAGTNIKNINGVSMLGSGNLTLTTPAAFDGSASNVANTAYVDQMTGNARGSRQLTTNFTLTQATDGGKTVSLESNTPFTVTLPNTLGSSGMMRFAFINVSTATHTIACQGGDTIYLGSITPTATISIPPNGGLILDGSTAAGYWYAVAGNAQGVRALPLAGGTLTGALTGTSGSFSSTLGASNLSGTNTGDQTITLTGDVTGTGTGSFATTIGAGKVTLAQQANMATASVVYRKTAGSGAPEVQTLATLKTDLGLTGTNSGDQTITLTGDVTGSGVGSFAATIGAGTVTLAKQATLAANSIIGNNTGSAATPLALTAAQTKTLLAIANTDVSGLGTMSTQNATAVAITGGTATGVTSLGLRNAGTGAFDMTEAHNGTLTAGRTLTWNLNDVARTISLSGNLTVSAAATVSNTNTGDQTITLTGDVTGSGTGSFAATIGAGTVTLAKQANLAANSFIGNNTGSPATPLALTTTQAKTLLAIANTDVSGLGTMSTQNATAIAVTGGTLAGVTGFALRNAGTGAFDMTETHNGTLTAGRTLTWNLNDAARTVSLSGNLTVSSAATVSGTNTGDQTITLTGDVTGSGTGSFAGTLSTVNSNVGSFTNASITVDGKGRITAASSGAGGGGTTTNALTFNNSNTGAASGTTFNGGTAQTISANTVGALALAGGTLTGKLNTLASATGGAGLNLPHGAAPTTPTNGDVWTTTAGTFARINGATSTLVDAAAIQGQTFNFFTTGGTSTAYTLTPAPALTALVTGQSFWVSFNTACGASPTLAVSGLLAKTLVKRNAVSGYIALQANEIPTNFVSRVTFTNTSQWLVEALPPVSPYLGVSGYTATTALTSADVNRQTYYNSATAGTLTMPPIATLPVGATISIFNLGAGVCTLDKGTSGGFWAKGTSSSTTISLISGESLVLVYDGTSWQQSAAGGLPLTGGTISVANNTTTGLTVSNTGSGSGVNLLTNFTNSLDADFQVQLSQQGAASKGAYIGPSVNVPLNLKSNNATVMTLNTSGAAVVGQLGVNCTALNSAILDLTQTASNGVQISMHGNGATTPNKTLRVLNGILDLVNSAYSAQIMIVDDNGNMTLTGTVTAPSDERLKTNWAALPGDFVEQLAQVKNGSYDRIDINQRQVGVSAQGLQKVMPEAVTPYTDNVRGGPAMLTVAYGHAALASAVELAKRVVDLEARLAALEAAR